MRRAGLAVLGGCLAFGCARSHHASVDPMNSARSGRYEVRFGAATIESRRPDGSPWHVTRGDDTAATVGGVVGFLLGHPELGSTVGGIFSEKGGDPLAPQPYVAMRVAGTTYRTMALQRTYAPTWQALPISFDVRMLRDDEPVVIQVLDATDDTLLGQTEMPLRDLLSRSAGTLTDLRGSVLALDVSVRPEPPRTIQEYDLRVPSERSLDELLRGEDPLWTTIDVRNGDTLTIVAQGQVCPGAKRGLVTLYDFAPERPRCFDANGVAERGWENGNYKGLKAFPHASLVAVTPETAIQVGQSAPLRVTESGPVLIFVNDTDADDNEGQFAVHVVVQPPP